MKTKDFQKLYLGHSECEMIAEIIGIKAGVIIVGKIEKVFLSDEAVKKTVYLVLIEIEKK